MNSNSLLFFTALCCWSYHTVPSLMAQMAVAWFLSLLAVVDTCRVVVFLPTPTETTNEAQAHFVTAICCHLCVTMFSPTLDKTNNESAFSLCLSMPYLWVLIPFIWVDWQFIDTTTPLKGRCDESRILIWSSVQVLKLHVRFFVLLMWRKRMSECMCESERGREERGLKECNMHG